MSNDDLVAPTMTKAEVNMLVCMLSKQKHKDLRERLKKIIGVSNEKTTKL